MGPSITAKYKNWVEVFIREMFDLANSFDVKNFMQ